MSKIKKPYAAVNSVTGVVTKRFKTSDKLAKFLFTPQKSLLGTITPASLLVVGVVITKEFEDGVEAALIDWEDKK